MLIHNIHYGECEYTETEKEKPTDRERTAGDVELILCESRSGQYKMSAMRRASIWPICALNKVFTSNDTSFRCCLLTSQHHHLKFLTDQPL